MSLLDRLCDDKCWERFYEYKTSLTVKSSFTDELRSFIDSKAYLPVCERINNGVSFPLPHKYIINKSNSNKKRIVYEYPKAENTVLKLLTYLLLREYDRIFSSGLYSFRPAKTAKDAVKHFAFQPEIREMYSYKADISNYFNSISVDMLLPMLNDTLKDDPRLFEFLKSLLAEPCVYDKGRIIKEQKGIMAGTPLSAFYANLFLSGLDKRFCDRNIPYARYSDDIIVFGKDMKTVEDYAVIIKENLQNHGLKINPDKECFSSPDEGWVFLGFRCSQNEIDIAPATVKKIKAKMHRKSRALLRWRKRNDIEGEKAASAFIRIFNKKLLDDPMDNELTWSFWFFSLINTDKSLRIIDQYAQDRIRFIISGTNKKSRFNVRYDDMKKLGYRSLVNAYYDIKQRS